MPREERKVLPTSAEGVPDESGQASIAMLSRESTTNETGNEGYVAETAGRPKRTRKQTQRFTNTPSSTETMKKPRAPRKIATRATAKGKGKATAAVENTNEGAKHAEDTSDQPPKKKARTTKGSAPKEEKRLAQFRSHCPHGVLERAERVRTQRCG